MKKEKVELKLLADAVLTHAALESMSGDVSKSLAAKMAEAQAEISGAYDRLYTVPHHRVAILKDVAASRPPVAPAPAIEPEGGAPRRIAFGEIPAC